MMQEQILAEMMKEKLNQAKHTKTKVLGFLDKMSQSHQSSMCKRKKKLNNLSKLIHSTFVYHNQQRGNFHQSTMNFNSIENKIFLRRQSRSQSRITQMQAHISINRFFDLKSYFSKLLQISLRQLMFLCICTVSIALMYYSLGLFIEINRR